MRDERETTKGKNVPRAPGGRGGFKVRCGKRDVRDFTAIKSFAGEVDAGEAEIDITARW